MPSFHELELLRQSTNKEEGNSRHSSNSSRHWPTVHDEHLVTLICKRERRAVEVCKWVKSHTTLLSLYLSLSVSRTTAEHIIRARNTWERTPHHEHTTPQDKATLSGSQEGAVGEGSQHEHAHS
jgi:hypothetical protein